MNNLEFFSVAVSIPDHKDTDIRMVFEYCDWPYEDVRVYNCDPNSIKGIAIYDSGSYYHFPNLYTEQDAKDALETMRKIDNYDYTHFNIIAELRCCGVKVSEKHLLSSIVEDYKGLMRAEDNMTKLFDAAFVDDYSVKGDIINMLEEAQKVLEQISKIDIPHIISALEGRK